jgi:membrane protease YdiL (CAAX protease family)
MLPAGLGVFGPLLAAVLVSRFEAGGAGVRALFRPLRIWRVGVWWYVIALGLPGALYVAGAAFFTFFGGRDVGPWFYPPDNTERIMAMLVIPFAEEIGWRGFALPRLQERYGVLKASLMLVLFWALWHFPMFIIVGVSASALLMAIPFFTAGSVVFSWIYNRTPAGLLLVLLAHLGAHLNNSHQALPGNIRPMAIHTAALVVAAILLVLTDRNVWRAAFPRAVHLSSRT